MDSDNITEDMIEAGAMTLDERIPWDQQVPAARAFMRLQAAAVLRAGLAGRTVIQPADGEYVMRDFGLDIDYQAGGVYVSLNHNPVARTEAWGDDVNVDYDKDGTPAGVEILRPRSVSAGTEKTP